MKSLSSRSALLFCAFSLVALAGVQPTAHAADTIQQDIVMELDSLGDGTLTITFRLSASQWTVWKQQYGDRPDVLWRDLRHQFAAYVLESFDLKKNDVERSATATLTFRGGTTLRSDGSQEIEIPKEMNRISGEGKEWIFNSVAQEGYGSPILTQTLRLKLPAEAENIRLNQPGTAFQALVYTVPQTSRGPGLLIAGAGFLAVGLVLGAVSFLPRQAPGGDR